jgi:hypothetical protein
MKLACIIILSFISIILQSCSGKDKAASSPSAAGNAPPEVVSAYLYPDKPVSNTQLIVHYAGRDRENDFIQYTFRWHVDNELVQDGPLGTLDPGKHKKGSEVYAEIIPSDSHATGKPFRTDTITIGNLPPAVSAISFSPSDPAVGAVITATPAGSDPDGDDVRYMYQWFVNGKAVTEQPQESNQFSTRGFRKKDRILAMVTPFDRDRAGEPKVSDILVLFNRAPQITSTPSTDLAGGVYLYQVTAKDPDGDKLTYSLLKSPQGMTINPSTGLVRWEPPKEVQAKTDIPIQISVDDGDGGKALQEFSLTLEMK